MSNGRGSNRRSRIIAMTTLVVVGVTAWCVAGCSQKPAEPTKTAGAKKDGDVHVKVDLPDTITIKP